MFAVKTSENQREHERGAAHKKDKLALLLPQELRDLPNPQILFI
jgi:hypothetical protein